MTTRYAFPAMTFAIVTLVSQAVYALDLSGIARSHGIPGGVAVTVGVEEPSEAITLAKSGPFLVQMLTRNADALPDMREAIREAGVAGQVSVDLWRDARLPYADNMVNVLVCDIPVPEKEVFRVLTPGGIGYHAEIALPLTKPWPDNIDCWPHYRHGADGNPVAQDMQVAPPKHLQWKAGPNTLRSHETDSAFSAGVIGGGRFFYIVDEATTGTAGQQGLPDKWSLIARDAFNGVQLWKLPVDAWGWREWKDTWFLSRPGDMPLNRAMRFVASRDGLRLFATLGYHAPVSEINGATGEILRTFEGTENTRELLLIEEAGKLVLSRGVELKRGAPAEVMLVDLETGKVDWTSDTFGGTATDYVKWKGMNGGVPDQTLDPALNIACDRRTIVLINGTSIVGLDFTTSETRWSKELADAKEPTLWLGALILADGRAIYADRTRMFCLDAVTGDLLWRQDKKYLGHLWYEWKDVFVIDGVIWTWSPEIVRGEGGLISSPVSLTGYDLKTGERVRDVPMGPVMKAVHHHRCYPNRATPRFVLASRRGTEYLDLASGEHSVNNWVRGTCHFGMIPALGMQFATPHPCRCFFLEKLNGLNTLAPASYYGEAATIPDEQRLTRGPAYGDAHGESAASSDWPTFRADAGRSCSSASSTVPSQLQEQWAVQLGDKPSAPTVAAGMAFVTLPEADQLIALDAATGEERWRFHVGAGIDSPPTYIDGSLLFGARDGAVYCLRATDGALRWRFMAADVDRRVNVHGRLEAAQPVHGAILVRDGLAYFAAGRSSYLDGGIKLYALNVATGEVVHHERLDGPHYNSNNIEANDQRVLPQGALADVMTSQGDSIGMRGYRFDTDFSNMQEDKTSLNAKAGMLDGTYFRRLHMSVGGDQNHAEQIAMDDNAAYLARMFKKMIFLSPEGGYSPGVDGFQLIAVDRDGLKKKLWERTIPVRVRAMAVADGKLIVAGPPEAMPKDDPHAAYEGRLGAVLLVVDTQTGETLRELTLDSPPVLNGIAIANDKLYVTQENGEMVCWGE